MTVNTELLQQVMQHIEDHPEQHDQASWVRKTNDCGTAACFAGWAVLLSDMEPIKDLDYGVFTDSDGYLYSTAEAAQHLLGLTTEECDVLFHAANSRDALHLMVKDLVNGEPLLDGIEYRNEAPS